MTRLSTGRRGRRTLRRSDRELWDEWGVDFSDPRTIMLHMITETACHAGHPDAAGELIDERRRIVID